MGMKVKLLLISLFLFTKVFGQTDTLKFSFGIKSCFGVSLLSSIDKYESNGYSKTSFGNFAFGFSSSFNIYKNISIGCELLYNHRGGGYNKINNDIIVINTNPAFKKDEDKEYYTNNYIIKSIDGPVYFKFNRYKYKFSPYFYLGATPSITTKSTYKYNTWDTQSFFADETWHTEKYENLKGSFSFGYLGGIGCNIKKFNFEIRYTNFLNNKLMIDQKSQSKNNHAFNFIISFNFCNKRTKPSIK